MHTAMSSMSGMPMPGGWTLSMMWMRMPGQTWLGVAASFLGMWIAMMAAMMLPSIAVQLRRYRRTGAGSTVLAGGGYLAVWAAIGMVVFPVGAGLAALAMREPALSRAAPMAAGVVVMIAGSLQLTKRKARRLERCGHVHEHESAWRYGLQLGVQCVGCCANVMAILLVVGVMDLRAMALATAAVTAERLTPFSARVARWTGAAALAVGVLMIVRASA